MSWRPEKWENPYTKHRQEKQISKGDSEVLDSQELVFELGADTMHQAMVEWLLQNSEPFLDAYGYQHLRIKNSKWQEFKEGL